MDTRASLPETKKNETNQLNRIFPTPTAKEPHYQFIKTEDNLSPPKEFKIHDSGTHHRAFSREKKKKPGIKWYEIYNSTVAKVNADRRNAFIVTAGEIYNLAFGGPKYRILKKESDDIKTTYISKGINGFVDFFDYIRRDTYINQRDRNKATFGNEHFLEGMGRVLLTRYLYQEDDLTFGNIGVDSEGNFVSIDPGYTFSSLTHQLEDDAHKKKYTSYCPLNPEFQKEGKCFRSRDEFQSWWFINEMMVCETGTHPHQQDYDSLPLLRHFLPRNWEFIDQLPHYSKQLAKNSRFLNEKHFAALKELITKQIKLELVHIHISHDQDREDLHGLLKNTLDNFLHVVSKSTDFLNYLKKNRISALKTILYEVHEFLLKNKHYRCIDPTDAKKQWQQIYAITTQEFIETLDYLKQPNLSNAEKIEIENFASGIQNNNTQDLKSISHFYSEQGMITRAKNVNLRIHSQLYKENKLSIFSTGPGRTTIGPNIYTSAFNCTIL